MHPFFLVIGCALLGSMTLQDPLSHELFNYPTTDCEGDNLPPLIVVHTPLPGTVAGDCISLKGTIVEQGILRRISWFTDQGYTGDIDQMSFTQDGTIGFYYHGIPLERGNNTITIVAVDGSGHLGTQVVTVSSGEDQTRDEGPPVIGTTKYLETINTTVGRAAPPITLEVFNAGGGVLGFFASIEILDRPEIGWIQMGGPASSSVTGEETHSLILDFEGSQNLPLSLTPYRADLILSGPEGVASLRQRLWLFVLNPEEIAQKNGVVLPVRAIVPWVVNNCFYQSELAIYNDNEQPIEIGLWAVDHMGRQGRETIRIEAGNQFQSSAETLFPGMNGYALYLISKANQFHTSYWTNGLQEGETMISQASAVPMAAMSSRLLLSFAPNSYRRALVLTTPVHSRRPIPISLALYSGNGNLVTTRTLLLERNKPHPSTLADLFGDLPADAMVIARTEGIPLAGASFSFGANGQPATDVALSLKP